MGGNNMKKALLLMTAAILITITGLAGCGNQETANQTSGQAAKNIKQEITTNLAGEPYTLDPAFASDTTSFWVIDHLYEGLYTYDKKGNIVEGAASKIETSDDGKTYTFTIRDGAKWSNGDKVTAKDFEYSWKRVLNPATGAYDASSMYYIKGAEAYNTGKGNVEDVGIKAVDDQTLVVELSSPLKFFPKIMMSEAYLPVNPKVVEANKNWAAEAAGIVTNGAYTVKDWKHDAELSLTKSKTYWNAKKITMNDIHFKMVADATTYYQMFKTGELDLIKQLPIDSIEQEKSNAEFVSHPQFSVYTYTFNVNEKPFNNKKIRQAFSYAIDRKAITESVSKAGEIPAYGYVPNGVKTDSGKDFRDEAPKYYPFDPKKAKQLLKEGLEEEGLAELPAVTFKYNTADNHKKIVEALQEMLKQNLGVEVKLENQEWKTFIDTFKQKNFQAARMGWVGDFLDPIGVLHHYTSTDSNNFTSWSNSEYDALIEQATIEQDEAKRYELLHQAEDILMEELPILPIYYQAQNALVSKKFEGIRFAELSEPDLRFAKKISE